MATSYPTSIDNTTNLPNPLSTDTLLSVSHSALHTNVNDAIKAIETKLGIGATITSVGTIATGTWNGTTIALANGGTGKTSAPSAMANLMGYTSTITAAATTVLTNTSSYYQQFTGTTTQTITLPVTSTLQAGWTFHIVNNSTGNLTVNSSGANLVITVIPGTTAMVTCIGTALTTAADWEFGLTDFSTYTGTGAVVFGTGPTITLANATGLPLTTGTSGILPVAKGGTEQTGTITTVAPIVTTTPIALATNYKVQFTPNATVALTTTVPAAGVECTLIVLTSGVTAYTLTFSTGFVSQGTLSTGTVTAKYFIFKFISNGTNLLEVSRTLAM